MNQISDDNISLNRQLENILDSTFSTFNNRLNFNFVGTYLKKKNLFSQLSGCADGSNDVKKLPNKEVTTTETILIKKNIERITVTYFVYLLEWQRVGNGIWIIFSLIIYTRKLRTIPKYIIFHVVTDTSRKSNGKS